MSVGNAVEQAAQRLAPQVARVLEETRALSSERRADGFVFVEATLLPNHAASSHFPNELTWAIGASPVGSRPATGKRTLILSVPDAGLEKLNRIVQGQQVQSRTERQAREQIRELEEISLSAASDVLRQNDRAHAFSTGGEATLWEAILNPVRRGEPLEEQTLAKWRTFVTSLGGEFDERSARVVSGLVFMPIRIAKDEALRVAEFNPLRTLRPMPVLGVRSVPSKQGPV